MKIFLYFLSAVGLYFLIALFVEFYTASKVIKFFREHPNGLPNELPPFVQEFKDEVGDANFNKLYRDIMGR